MCMLAFHLWAPRSQSPCIGDPMVSLSSLQCCVSTNTIMSSLKLRPTDVLGRALLSGSSLAPLSKGSHVSN